MVMPGAAVSTVHRWWLGFISVIVAVVLAAAGGIFVTEGQSVTRVPAPPEGSATLTAYGQISVPEGSSRPVSAVLSGVESSRLRALIQSAWAVPAVGSCMENELVFTYSSAPEPDGSTAYLAQDYLCPQPGLLVIQRAGSTERFDVQTCSLISYVVSLFPAGEVAGTRSALNFCASPS
jgi:hypothetical protein